MFFHCKYDKPLVSEKEITVLKWVAFVGGHYFDLSNKNDMTDAVVGCGEYSDNVKQEITKSLYGDFEIGRGFVHCCADAEITMAVWWSVQKEMRKSLHCYKCKIPVGVNYFRDFQDCRVAAEKITVVGDVTDKVLYNSGCKLRDRSEIDRIFKGK